MLLDIQYIVQMFFSHTTYSASEPAKAQQFPSDHNLPGSGCVVSAERFRCMKDYGGNNIVSDFLPITEINQVKY